MPLDKPVLLLTRPEAASRRFLAEVRRGTGDTVAAVISPLMRPRFLDVAVPETAEIAFTSETAVRAVARLGPDRSARAWCVGSRTAAAAREAGFRTSAGGGTGELLAAAMIRSGLRGPVFCPVAADQAFDIASALSSAGIETVSAVVYEQESCAPTAEAQHLLAGTRPVVLPLFSVRSARLAAAAFAGHRAPLRVAALSDQIAAVDGLRAECCLVAARPEAPAMVAVVLRLLGPSDAG